MPRHVLRIVTHPATIIAGVVSGLLFGFYLPEQAHALVPLAKLYVALLSMSMLPIVVTALTWGIGQMLRNATTRVLLGPGLLISQPFPGPDVRAIACSTSSASRFRC